MTDHRTRADLRAENERLRDRVAHLEGALAAAVTLSAGASDGIQALSSAIGGDVGPLLRDLFPAPLASVEPDSGLDVVRAPVLRLPTRTDKPTAAADAPATAVITEPSDKDQHS